ncbi:MAG: hypothetical protein AAFX76_10370 [Planctomycetota bacterium]
MNPISSRKPLTSASAVLLVVMSSLTGCVPGVFGTGGNAQAPEPPPPVPRSAATPAEAPDTALPGPLAQADTEGDTPPPPAAAGSGPAPTDTTAPGPPPPGGNVEADPSRFTPAMMQQAVRNFADQYRQTIAEAADQIVVEADDDPDLRRRAHQMKINGATAMYDIAVDPVPPSALLNAVVLTSLQVNFLEAHAEKFFGGYAPLLQDRANRLEEEAFSIAARVMSPEQRTDLLRLIDEWSAANPDNTDIWYVRLADLPGVQQGLSMSDVVGSFTNLPSNFINIFNPFSKGQDAVNEGQLLLERTSWLAPRLMILAQWRAEAVVYDSIANTRVNDALDLGERFAVVAETLPDTLTQQRRGLVEDLANNQENLTALLHGTQQVTADTTQMLMAADAITARVQEIQAAALAASANRPPRDPNAPPPRPFDITEYTAALYELNQVVGNATTLLETTDTATAGPALDARLDAVAATVTRLILTAAAAALVVGVLLVLTVKWVPRRAHTPTPKPT